MRTLAVIRKEVLHLMRDIRLLYFSFIWPVLLLLIFGFTVSFEVRNIKLVYFDLDGKEQSRELISSFQATGYFDMTAGSDFSWQGSQKILDRGEAKAVIIIPAGFARQIARQETTKLQLLVDGSDNNTASIMLGYVAGITESYNEQIILERMNRAGHAQAVTTPIDARLQFLFNPSLRSQNFIVPGLIAVIMMIIGTLLTTLTITVEWERGTMEQLLYTPIRPIELILGKITPYFVISIIQVTTVLLASIIIFKVPFKGSIPVFYFASALFLLGALGVGLFLSLISKTQQFAMMLAFLVTFLPAFLLSGFIFPIDSMPIILQLISYLVPAKYFLNIIHATFLKGAGFNVLWINFVAMFAFSMFFIVMSIARFKKRID
jgi:ABC-2 type transport system permease protein